MLKTTTRSDINVSHSVRARTCYLNVFWLLAALCLMNAGSPSWAAGCHVQDRPVLQSTLSWEIDQRTELVSSPIGQAPLVLTHPPCGGEVPLASGSPMLLTAVVVDESSGFESPELREPILVPSRTKRPQPPSLRLDRPPRPNVFSVKQPV
jgi:hypothetical protein